MSLKVLFWIGQILDQCTCQDESFATLDGVEVRYNRFRETFHGDTTKAAPSNEGSVFWKEVKLVNGIQVAIRSHGEIQVSR